MCKNLLPYSNECTLSVVGGEENIELSVNRSFRGNSGPNEEVRGCRKLHGLLYDL